MLFCEQKFLVFFTLIFTVYWCMPWQRARVWLLVGASFYFYASWNKWLALLIGVSTVLDYLIARGMDADVKQFWRRLLLVLSLVGNLGLLCYFKYMNFFLDSLFVASGNPGHGPTDPVPDYASGILNYFLDWFFMSSGLDRGDPSVPLLKVLLPVGISFYTFEAINYTVDVFRKKIPAEKNLANFMLFITFFPHLVAGPIVRARDFLPQIYRRKRWSWPRLQLGAQFFLLGLFKKLAIADRMALFADPVFLNPDHYGSSAVWMAMIAYAVQIYCDFSGYTDMAIGSAHMLGYKLAMNFNMPYLSANVSEFWRRWHMSLSTWLRDYLFIPLGGSRGPSWKTDRNLLITMTLGGLWHGAAWTFVAWGVLHGVLLILHRHFRTFCASRPRLDWFLQSPVGTLLRVQFTFLCVCVGWVFFRSQGFDKALIFLQRLVVPLTNGSGAPLHNRSLVWTCILILVCHVLVHYGWWKYLAVRLPAPVLGLAYAVVLTMALVLAPDSGKAFIYFNF